MKKTIVIHTDALRREYSANWFLAQSLKKKGYNVFLTSRLTTKYFVSLIRPDILILSHVFSIPEDILTSFRNIGIQVYVNEVEGEIEGNETGILGTYPDNIDYTLFSGIFVWSQWTKKWLIQKYNLNTDQIHGIGCTRLSLLEVFEPQPVNHTVGFVSRFEVLNSFDMREAFENLINIDIETLRGLGYMDRLITDAFNFAYGMQVVEKLIESGIRVLIRPHPNEDFKSYKFLKNKFGANLEIDTDPDYINFLQQISVILAPLSSALTEPYLLDIPIVSLGGLTNTRLKIEYQKYFINTFSKTCYSPTNIKEIVELCSIKNLKTIKNVELDKMFSDIYSLDLNNDPISQLIEIINSKSKGSKSKKSFLSFFSPLVKYSLDFLIYFYAYFKRYKNWNVSVIKQYHYNSLIHRPSKFMRRL
jgi:surface carbohydrate biosynthesis protein